MNRQVHKSCGPIAIYSFALVALASHTLSGAVTAQTFALNSFGDLNDVTGANPHSQLVQGPDGTLYGTANYGEFNVKGTVFKLQPDGSGFNVLKWFTNSVEGAIPYASLTLSGSVLYGTTKRGGSSDGGTVFKLNTDGTGYTVLWSCPLSYGHYPSPDLTLSGSTLYGTTYGTMLSGGGFFQGTVFKLNTDGKDYTVLKHFGRGDGKNPFAGLTLSGSVLYGTTFAGGSSDGGTVFKLNVDGSGYKVLKQFSGSDGQGPDGRLTLSGSTLYGTTKRGGRSECGTVFKVNTDGTGFAVLKHFTGSDGKYPQAGLTLSGAVLYGTASSSDGSPRGTVFKLNTDGTGYTILKRFTCYPEGSGPVAGLLLSGSTLYGTTRAGGIKGNGTVFKVNTDGTDYAVLNDFSGGHARNPSSGLGLSGSALYGTKAVGGSLGGSTSSNIDLTNYIALWHIPHSLSIQRAQNDVTLSWPAIGTNFVLEATSDLGEGNWQGVSGTPSLVNDQCVVTLAPGPAHQFFRLRRK